MAYRCALCDKGKMIGRQHRHHKGVAGGKWLQRAQKTVKVFRPNLHAFNGFLNGEKGKWLLCTKCLRKVKANLKEKAKKPADASSKPALKKETSKSDKV